MSRFVNDNTGVLVSVDDSKDVRFVSGWTAEADEKKTPAKKSASSKTQK